MFDQHFGPNMTPMVDVTLVILIFFMASTAFLGPEWFVRAALPVRGPRSASQDQPTTLRVTLGTDDNGRTLAAVADRSGLDPGALESFLAAEALRAGVDKVVVIVEPSPQTPYEDVVRVHELCARLKIKVGLAP